MILRLNIHQSISIPRFTFIVFKEGKYINVINDFQDIRNYRH